MTGPAMAAAAGDVIAQAPVGVGDATLPGGEDDAAPVRRSGLMKTVGGLSSVNVVLLLTAMVTGPLQAHALGPTGRGELAQVLVPISLGAVVLEFGLGTYAMREAARGRPAGVLLGTLYAILLPIGLIAALVAQPVATLLVGGHSHVHGLLTVGLILLPLGLLANLAGGICAGLQRWRAYSFARLIPPVGTAVLMGVLMVIGDLDVTTAAVLSFGLGGLALVPVLAALRGGGRLRFDREVAREGVRFGLRAWMGSLVGMATTQVGMLIMVKMAGAAQLGLYVVAANIAGSADVLSTSVAGAIMPRIAGGDEQLAARACRVTVLLVGTVASLAALTAPLLLPIVFGSRFQASVGIVEFLLITTLATAASNVLGAYLLGVGRPGVLAVDDILALGLGAPALILVLPVLGALGAAMVGAGASLIGLAFLLLWSRRVSGISLRSFLVVTRADVRWVLGRIVPHARRIPFVAQLPIFARSA